MLGGGIAGVVIMFLAKLVDVWGPSGDGWSYRGNGALVVPFELGPVVLAAGWTMLILHGRSHARWIVFGVAAALVELAIAAVSNVALVVGGSAVGGAVSLVAQPIMVLVIVVSPAVALFFPMSGVVRTRPAWSHFFSAMMLPVGLIVGLIIGGFLVS